MTEPTDHTVKIIYRDWELVVDKELTKQTYDKIPAGSPEGCTCAPCKNFIHNRESTYPDEIKQLFADLGIDYKKECEISHYCRMDNGLHFYGGWFHFKGRFIRKHRPSPEANDGSIDFVNVHDNFEIGFYDGNMMSFFESKEGLVQVEFGARIPWSIDKSLESE